MVKRIFLIFLIAVMLTSCGQKAPTWQEQYGLGVRYLSEGNYEEAIIAFTAAIEIDPKQALAYVGRGNAYAAFGDTASAIADYQTALGLDETLEAVYETLADLYIQTGDPIQAEAVLRQGLEVTGSAALQTKLDALTGGAEGTADDVSGTSTASGDFADYFSDPLCWDEVTYGGVPVEECALAQSTEEMVVLHPNAEVAMWFSNHDGYKAITMHSGPFDLDFRGIHYGMDQASLCRALGFTEKGQEFVSNAWNSQYIFNNGSCEKAFDIWKEAYGMTDEEIEEKRQTLETSNDRQIVLMYGDFGQSIDFILRDEALMYVSIEWPA